MVDGLNRKDRLSAFLKGINGDDLDSPLLTYKTTYEKYCYRSNAEKEAHIEEMSRQGYTYVDLSSMRLDGKQVWEVGFTKTEGENE